MERFKNFLYGLLLGIASIAPGLSGGTIAIALGFYESLIEAIANILKQFKKNFLYLLPFGLGVVISLAAFSVIFDFLFENFPLPTNMLFIGFILGTLPFLKKSFVSSLDGSKYNMGHILTGIVFFIIVLIPTFVKHTDVLLDIANGSASVITFLFIGVVIAMTTIIPGLSGTMILTAMGCYQPLLSTASTFVTAVVTLDMATAASQLSALIPLGIGVLLGGFLLAKALNWLFKKIPSYIYSVVIGLIIATPIVMLGQVSMADVTLINVIVGLITFFAGLFLVRKLGD